MEGRHWHGCPFRAGAPQVICCVLLFLLSLAAPLGAQVTLTPGRVTGNVTFTNVTAEVSTYLASSPVVNYTPSSPADFPVRLYPVGNALPSTAAYYTPLNAVPSAQTYTGASYDIYPNVAATGSDFVLEISPIAFSNAATYRFGSLEAGSSSYRLCQGVLPLANNPGGTSCDIGECAIVLPLRIKLIGGAVNQDAFDRNQPMFCRAEVYAKETPLSPAPQWQASSHGAMFTDFDRLASTGEDLPILIRASNSEVTIRVNCTAKIKTGLFGWPILPASGLTPFGGEIKTGPFACGARPGPIAVDVKT